MTRILLFGATGQIGWELNRSLLPLGEVIALTRNDADFADLKGLREIIRHSRAEIIVNAAAYTDVDRAEGEESRARTVNADAPAVLAEEAIRLGALLVHYSTDYVFDGTKSEPYVESDQANPVNAYGRTKLAGERNIQSINCRHLILRTSWVYSPRRENFLATILRLAQQQDELAIVADQIGAPTSARLIADVTSAILFKIRGEEESMPRRTLGLYHLTSANHTSWYDFAKAILDYAPRSKTDLIHSAKLLAIPTERFPQPARRPKNSRLNCDTLRLQFGVHLPDWGVSLRLCLAEMNERSSDP
jgi:dTDP-4-dehydrorhamnose reductase